MGDWAEVAECFTPKNNSEGGCGSIIFVHERIGPAEEEACFDDCIKVNVQYMLTGWVERRVVLTRVHVVPFALKRPIAVRDLRPRARWVVKSASTDKLGMSRDATEPSDISEERTAVEWLKFGLSSRRHEKFGWLRDSLRSIGKIGDGMEEIWDRILHDYKEQLA